MSLVLVRVRARASNPDPNPNPDPSPNPSPNPNPNPNLTLTLTLTPNPDPNPSPHPHPNPHPHQVSLVLGIGSVAVLDREAVLRGGFFQGYTWFTCFVVLQVSLGGMLVALVMKYAARQHGTLVVLTMALHLPWHSTYHGTPATMAPYFRLAHRTYYGSTLWFYTELTMVLHNGSTLNLLWLYS